MSRAWLEIVADAAEGVPEERLVEIASNAISIEDRHVATPVVLMPSMVARPWVVLAKAADNGTQLTNDSIEAYRVWMLPELHSAMIAEPTLRKIRNSVARSLVRVGAWMLPDRPDLVSDTILVLPKPATRRTVQKAASRKLQPQSIRKSRPKRRDFLYPPTSVPLSRGTGERSEPGGSRERQRPQGDGRAKRARGIKGAPATAGGRASEASQGDQGSASDRASQGTSGRI